MPSGISRGHPAACRLDKLSHHSSQHTLPSEQAGFMKAAFTDAEAAMHLREHAKIPPGVLTSEISAMMF